MNSSKIKIVLADDHPLLRLGLKEVIEGENDLTVVGEAEEGRRTLEIIEQLKPDIALIDIDMPLLNGLEVAAKVAEKKLSTAIIILTMHSNAKFFYKALDLGVMGYILKDCATSEIVSAIRMVYGGKRFISHSLSEYLINRSTQSNTNLQLNEAIENLTNMQKKILKLVSQNKTSKEIAELLFISERTVETHRANICTRLELKGINALLRFALDNKDIF